ncbi:hypothetical protein [Bacteroides mediterraneensis]|uniref:Uncharacterized protein n=1 Tax=Bacteroides mediterraneensis TaxID=1841856 RepID=A0ABS2ERZ1_9BACE|nr:hypothetical protein [Bacteroides mediterraneensis]MBM6757341.1 hypothetical protein [Bacteroides mediterraneensis]MBM6781497.1 hypothetical protein [Bacteroides mediterraneensis]
MKRLGLTLVAALAFSVSMFAEGVNENNNAQKWNGSINKSKLTQYLNLSSTQNEKVADICDYFEQEMTRANYAKTDHKEKVRKAVYGNLKLMKQTLDDKQYSSYVRLMAMTLRNKGIDLNEAK